MARWKWGCSFWRLTTALDHQGSDERRWIAALGDAKSNTEPSARRVSERGLSCFVNSGSGDVQPSRRRELL